MVNQTTQHASPLSEADQAHRFGRWVGVPLLCFIAASVLAVLVFVVGLVVALFSIRMND